VTVSVFVASAETVNTWGVTLPLTNRFGDPANFAGTLNWEATGRLACRDRGATSPALMRESTHRRLIDAASVAELIATALLSMRRLAGESFTKNSGIERFRWFLHM
jgi:hypothetical protein